MLLHKKIRFLRLSKGWSQETMAEKLEMSPNGYGSIERGETNVQISRILQIAKLFDVSASELFQDTKEKNVFDSTGHHNHNTEIQNNNNSSCFFGATELFLPNQSQCQRERQQLEFSVEKQIASLEQKDKEIFLLKQINELLTAAAAAAAAAKLMPHRIYHRRIHFTNKEEPQIQEQRKENVPRFETNLSNC